MLKYVQKASSDFVLISYNSYIRRYQVLPGWVGIWFPSVTFVGPGLAAIWLWILSNFSSHTVKIVAGGRWGVKGTDQLITTQDHTAPLFIGSYHRIIQHPYLFVHITGSYSTRCISQWAHSTLLGHITRCPRWGILHNAHFGKYISTGF